MFPVEPLEVVFIGPVLVAGLRPLSDKVVSAHKEQDEIEFRVLFSDPEKLISVLFGELPLAFHIRTKL